MTPMLIDELRGAVIQAQANTHRRYACSTLGRYKPPCPSCDDAALRTANMSVVQVDLPPNIFLMVDNEVWHCMHRFGWFDHQSEYHIDYQRFMDIPVILAPYTRGWKVCRGA